MSAILWSGLNFALNLIIHVGKSRLNLGYHSFADYTQEPGKD
ncbi:hypothetical protein OQJ35_12110 [Legionella pneumophila]|nr:hypothetical protein [Legionella pneumophila]MCW8429259.1 hypothetical protein [Legionella pneumophila]